ncbi:MAG: thioredoxin family protein [Planctomycetota bacterium]
MARFMEKILFVAAFAVSVICAPTCASFAEDDDRRVSDEPVVSESEGSDLEAKSADAAIVQPVQPRALFQHESYPAAWKAAQESNRPILVFVSMPNCHYCVKMKQKVYQQPRVKQLVSSSFETIKADRFAHPKLVSSLKIRLYPTTVLVGPNNKILDVIEGYADANAFQRRLQTGIASSSRLTAATATR